MKNPATTRVDSVEPSLDVTDEYSLIRVLRFLQRLEKYRIPLPTGKVDEHKMLRECTEEIRNVMRKVSALRIDIPEATYCGLEQCQDREGQPDMGKLCTQILTEQLSKYAILDDAA